MKRRRFDRVQMGNSEGSLVEIFDPSWWRLDRWIRWALTKRPRRRLQFFMQDVTGRHCFFDVRCVVIRTVPICEFHPALH